ncbi:hypothetical protein K435DRAFT_627791, partial [Dendrothele bispora CBS 962.96]
SLLDLFPSILPGTLLDIARHEFLPADLRKLNTHLRDNTDEVSGRTPGASGSFKEYPTFASLHRPLCTYFAVLTQFASGTADATTVAAISHGAFEYCNLLHSYAQDYEWSAVVRYHMAFHDVQRREMANGNYAGWGKPDIVLMGLFLVGRNRRTTSGS